MKNKTTKLTITNKKIMKILIQDEYKIFVYLLLTNSRVRDISDPVYNLHVQSMYAMGVHIYTIFNQRKNLKN